MTILAIKERIAKELIESGKSQNQIAKAIGVKQPTINEYIKGKSAPALDTLAKICKYLDLDANYILGIADYSGQKKL